MPNGSIKQKFKFQVGHTRQPLLQSALLAKSPRVRPIVKYHHGAIHQPRPRILQAFERRRIDVAIDPRITKMLRQQRFRGSQALREKSRGFLQFSSRVQLAGARSGMVFCNCRMAMQDSAGQVALGQRRRACAAAPWKSAAACFPVSVLFGDSPED